MPTMPSPYEAGQVGLSPLFAALMRVLGQKKDEEIRETQLERQAKLDAVAEEERARQRSREDLQQQLSLGEVERAGAARTPILPESGEPLPGAPAGPPIEAESVGVKGKFQTLKLPDGREIPLGPLQSKTELEREQEKTSTLALLQKLGYREAEEAIESKYRPKPKPDKTLEEIETEAEARARGGRRGAPPISDREPADPNETAAVAMDWLEGRRQPSTQRGATEASAYIRALGKKPPRIMSDAQWTEVAQSQGTLSKIDDIELGAKQMQEVFGPLKFTLNELRQRVPGLESDPRFAVVQTLIHDARNLDIKRITGAQMSEPEAQRLFKGMIDGTVRFDEFMGKLGVMRRNANRTVYQNQGRLEDFNKDFPLSAILPEKGKAGETGGAAGGAAGAGKTVGKYKILSVE